MLQGGRRKNLPSLRIAMIRTMKGGKSNFHIRASSIKPTYCKKKQYRKINYTETTHDKNYKMPLNKGKGVEGTTTNNIPRYEW